MLSARSTTLLTRAGEHVRASLAAATEDAAASEQKDTTLAMARDVVGGHVCGAPIFDAEETASFPRPSSSDSHWMSERVMAVMR